MTESDSSLIRRLRRLDCCTVSDALDKVGLRGRVSTGLPCRSGNHWLVGRAVTMRLAPAAEVKPPPGAPRHLGTGAIEAARPGDVIVIEQRTGIDAGCWGGLLTLGAKLRGVGGVVADGPVRDIDEAREHDFPVFCRHVTAITARGRLAEAEVHGAVQIGDVTVENGDYVVADGSGVAFVPAAEIERVLLAAEVIATREAHLVRALLDGAPISQVMGRDYEDLLRRASGEPS